MYHIINTYSNKNTYLSFFLKSDISIAHRVGCACGFSGSNVAFFCNLVGSPSQNHSGHSNGNNQFIKKITKSMMGFKSFDSAKATIAGTELHHILKKEQHNNADNMTIFEQFYDLALSASDSETKMC